MVDVSNVTNKPSNTPIEPKPNTLAALPVIDWIVHWLLKVLSALACLYMGFLILITCVDVVGRYFLNQPLPGSSELTEITLGLLIFSSIPVITYESKHIVVDLLDAWLPSVAKQLIRLFSYVLIGLGFWLIADYSGKLITRSLRRDVMTEYLEIPVGYIMLYAQAMCYITSFLMAILVFKIMLTHFKANKPA